MYETHLYSILRKRIIPESLSFPYPPSILYLTFINIDRCDLLIVSGEESTFFGPMYYSLDIVIGFAVFRKTVLGNMLHSVQGVNRISVQARHKLTGKDKDRNEQNRDGMKIEFGRYIGLNDLRRSLYRM